MRYYSQLETANYLRTSRWTIARLIARTHLRATSRGVTADQIAALVHAIAIPTPEEPMPKPAGVPYLFTLAEVAAQSNGKLTLRWLQDGARKGRFRHRRIGRQRLMTQEDIDLLTAADKPSSDGSAVRPHADAAVAAELERRSRRGRRSAA